MSQQANQEFGKIITSLIAKKNLTRAETKKALIAILNNKVTEMHQGAFLAALTSKSETKDEVAGIWEAVYELDTTKVHIDISSDIVDNCGTGMDTFKTFNISTAASIVAAAGSIPMARHGARAITSVCGTVDMAEALGIDVDCSAEVVANSVKTANLGLFNGMSPKIHPRALGRILSQINFGTTLNIAASLANPALPSTGVRGVYAKEMITPVADVMKEIGYRSAIVLHGTLDDSDKGMDEASVCGTTYCAKIDGDKPVETFTIDPGKLGLKGATADDIAPEPDIKSEARRFAALMANQEQGLRKNAVILNAGLIFLAAGKAGDLDDGIEQSAKLLESGKAFAAMENWVQAQTSDPEKGLKTLYKLMD